MIPSCEQFLLGLRFYARRHGLPERYDNAAVAQALVEAGHLAVTESDEPAALFFACARYSRAFVARGQAQSLGLELNVEDLEFEILRARILLGAIDFEEVRARFAIRLRPRG
jgi:hypothetical protein